MLVQPIGSARGKFFYAYTEHQSDCHTAELNIMLDTYECAPREIVRSGKRGGAWFSNWELRIP